MMTTSANSSLAGLLRRSSLGLGAAAAVALPTAALAQIMPDGTLGNEGSTVTEGAIVRSGLADLVEGGAVRGSNLFHSFLEFNIEAGQRVYFANPAGVESILSRVTGANPSNIFGTLGVDGAADLFLINPNGLVFGETAALDIEGSFYAATAAAIPLGDGVYSATEPAQSSLLTVSPSALFSRYLTQASGDIENRGQLAVQGDLTLAGNRLDLQGQLAAEGDLRLLGSTVQIRDAVDTPFVGFAGGDLLVQGNEQVDIVALSHLDSGLYSYGGMVLRSANPVGGDAHYFSGGSFRVENLDGEAGSLFSPIDPIIRAFGDIVIEIYEGSSLHILAGGSVKIGTALIFSPTAGAVGVDFLRESIELSNGTIVEIDGGFQPTLDVRAGVAPEAIGSIPSDNPSGVNPAIDFFLNSQFQPDEPNILDVPSSADIEISDIGIFAANGLILLTNNYEPNPLLEGSIFVTGEGEYGIDARGIGEQGGSIYIDARDNVSVVDSSISTSGIQIVGDIVINAGETIRFEQQNRITAASANLTAGVGVGGNIHIEATNVELLNGAQLQAITRGNGNAGDVVIEALGLVTFDGTTSNGQFGSAAFSQVDTEATGAGGNVLIFANSLEVTNGAQLISSTKGNGNSGNVFINAHERVVFNNGNVISVVEVGADGTGGNVEITTGHLSAVNGSQLQASTLGTGDAGNIVLKVREHVVYDNSDAFSTVEAGAIGAGGNIEITTNYLEVNNGSQLQASTSGAGNAGNVVIEAYGGVVFEGTAADGQFRSAAFSRVEAGATGTGGSILIYANSLEMLNGSQLTASTIGNGDAGDVVIEVSDRVVFDGGSAFSTVEAGATGTGGNILISAGSLEVLNGAQLTANTFGNGNAGDVLIDIDGQTRVTNGTVSSLALTASGGRINIRAGNLILRENSDILTLVGFGEGSGGNIEITADFVIALDDSDILAFSADGQGGDIDLSRTTFFGQNANIGFGSLTREELLALIRNDRVDINASGGVEPGQIAIGDSSFIENSLTSLADTIVDTSALTAGSCIARIDESLGSFTVTGSGGLPQRPGDTTLSTYPTGTVQTLATPAATATLQEPDGVYQLPDGRLVLSRTCE